MRPNKPVRTLRKLIERFPGVFAAESWEPHRPLAGKECQVLIGEGQDRNPAEVHLLLAGQCQQKVYRPLIPIELEHELFRRLPLTPSLFPPAWRIHGVPLLA